MSGFLSSVLSSAESTIQNDVSSLFGTPPVGPPTPMPPPVTPAPPLGSVVTQAPGQVPGIVPASPGQPTPPGMVPVYGPAKKSILDKVKALPTPYKLAGAAVLAWVGYEYVLKPKGRRR